MFCGAAVDTLKHAAAKQNVGRFPGYGWRSFWTWRWRGRPEARRCTIPLGQSPRTVFTCQECGTQQLKWIGFCPDCGSRNPLVEEQPVPETAPATANHRYGLVSGGASAKLYGDIQTSDAPRISSGIAEFDRVLGGGIVPGVLVLLGGEPGIGKSTLLLQVAAHVARHVGPCALQLGRNPYEVLCRVGTRIERIYR